MTAPRAFVIEDHQFISMTRVFQIAYKRLATTGIFKNEARHGQVPRANGLEVRGLVCCLGEKRLEIIDGKQDRYSVANSWLSFSKKNEGTDSPRLLSKCFEQRSQNSRRRGLIFETNIDQVEKRCALGK